MHKKFFRFLFITTLVFFVMPKLVLGASLSLSPASGKVELGGVLTARVLVSGGDVSLNAVSGDLAFPATIFAIESVSKANSILNFWVTEPTFSKSAGTVHFEGVSLSGYKGNSGTVVTVTLRAIKEGSGSATFKTSQILANDGEGSDITSGTSGATYTVIPAKIIEKPTPATPIIEEPEEPQIAPSLRAPEIILSRIYGEKVILGESEYPKAQAVVTFITPDGGKLFITTKADDEGGFTLLVPKALKRGDYFVTALMVKEDGTNSPASEKLKITIGNIFSDVGKEFYITLLLLILVIIYLIYRLHSRYKKGLPLVVLREVKEVEGVLKKSFEILRGDLKRVEQKNKSFGKEGLDKNEETDELRSDMDDAERVIRKKIDDIESP